MWLHSVQSCFCAITSKKGSYFGEKRLQKVCTYSSWVLLSRNDSCINNKDNTILYPSFHSMNLYFLLVRACLRHFFKVFAPFAERDFGIFF